MRFTLEKISDCAVFVVAATVSVAVGATAGAFLHTHSEEAGYWATWRGWWLAGEIGILIAAPVLLAWLPGPPSAGKKRPVETFAALLVTLVVSLFLFSAHRGQESILLTFPYWVFPCLIWTALRMGTRGSSSAMAIVASVAIANTLLSRGPFTFSADSLGGQLVALESFLIVAALSAMVLSAAIGERRAAQSALGESESRFRLMVENLPAGAIYRQDERIVLNKAAEAITGYSRLEIPTLDVWFRRLYQEESTVIRALYEEDRAASFPSPRRVPIRRKDGDVRIVEFSGFIDASCEVWILEDLTERLRAEEMLRDAERRYRNIFENAPDGIFQATPSGRLIAANPALAHMLGYPTPADLIAEVTDIAATFANSADRKLYRRLMEEHNAIEGFEYQATRKDGEKVWLSENARSVRDASGAVLFYEGAVKDVTARKSLEAQLAQSRKMEAVGQLAGGIAHDFNNLLTVISGYSQMLSSQLDSASSMKSEVSEIELAAARAASLTSQLLAFSRRQVVQPESLDLNEIVTGMQAMLRRLIREDILLKTSAGADLARVRADRGQIEQVIMNLVTNARDAITGSGEIVIETANTILTPEDSSRRLDCDPGPYVVLSVGDTGAGMDERTRSRIFEPFFTTKEIGRGTGLGLATVYGIVKQSRGDIRVESAPGRGTRFRIFLPAAPAEARVEEAPAREPVSAARSNGGSGTVLVVEDEPSVRDLVQLWLASLGYTVLAADAMTAVGVCEGHERIDLLVSDVVMPGMGGPALARKLRDIYPGMRVLFMSGYTDDSVYRNGILETGDNFLQKPFTPEVLAGKVRELLS
jgi:PAS domain S-box-containing protein